MISRNAAERIVPPQADAPEMVALDATLDAKLLEAARPTRVFVPVALALMIGLRRGEILALRWKDLALDGGTLHLQRSLEEAWVRTAEGKLVTQRSFKLPKTKRGRRLVALPRWQSRSFAGTGASRRASVSRSALGTRIMI